MNLRVFIFFSLLLLPIFLVAPARALANDDAVQFGSDITASPDHPIHDAVCFFCSVHAEGEVTGDIVVFFGDVHLNGTAHGDVVNFFGRTRLGDNAIVHGDLVKFFGSVRAGENAQAAKDLVIIFGSLRAPGSFSVGKDRFVMPGWVLWIPFIIFASIVIVIVRAFRAWQWRRNMYAGYPVAPHA
jgi:hypothetical protein